MGNMRLSIVKKLWSLLTRAERRTAVVLLGLMLIGMVLETLGVGVVVPALGLMTQEDVFTRYPRLASLLASFGQPSRQNLIVAGMCVLVVVGVVKAAFLSFLVWRQMRFVYGLQAATSRRLFAGYLRQPYTFHLQRNSSQLIRNALTEVNLLTQNGVLQGLTLLTESLVVLGICALLLYIEPAGAVLAVGTLVFALGGIYRGTRNPLLRWGEARQLHEGMRIQHLQQGLGGAKDVKLLGREAEFIVRYGAHTDASARVGERQHVISQLPRLVLELLAVVALAVLVIAMIRQGRPLDSLLPTIGVFAAAAFRIMPSANRIMLAIQVMRYSLPVVNVLYDEINLPCEMPSRGAPVPVQLRQALTLEDVQYWYSDPASPVVDGVTLTVQAGQTVGFVGGSGAGKTTLLDLMLGLLAPRRGVIRVDGLDVHTNLRSWQNRIGYVPQSVYLTDDSLRRNIAFGIADADIDDTAVWRAAKLAQIDQFIRELPQGLETPVGERGVRLSGGQLQRIGIARALYHDPDVLVLDEATSSLDAATERGVMESVRALHGEKTIIIVAHRLSTVEHCDRVFRLDQGRVIDVGSPSRVLHASHAQHQ